jgi:methylglyoxal synthase
MKTIALVAHDNKKQDIVEWCDFNKGTLSQYCLYATGTTGKRIMEKTGLKINLLKSGPPGWRHAAWSLNRRWKTRLPDILLGPIRIPTS